MQRTSSLHNRRVLFAGLAALIAASFLCVSHSSYGQSPSPSPGSPSSANTSGVFGSGLERRAGDFASSQPAADEEYQLGGGDELLVTVTGHPELSGAHTVGPDGRITLPIAGTIDIGEKSREDAAKLIEEAYAKYFSGPVATTVQVTHYGSNHILMLGAIEHTGIISFDQPPTLLEAIARGGSLIQSGQGGSTSGGGGTPRRCIVFRGDNQVWNVNISEQLDGQRALNNIHLRRNDTIYIPESQESLISVLGEVGHSGPVQLHPNSTLVSVLASSGGVTPQGGNADIRIVETSTGRVQHIKYKDLLKPGGGSDISLHDGDIVYVPRSGLATLGFVMQQIAPVAALGSVATFAIR